VSCQAVDLYGRSRPAFGTSTYSTSSSSSSSSTSPPAACPFVVTLRSVCLDKFSASGDALVLSSGAEAVEVSTTETHTAGDRNHVTVQQRGEGGSVTVWCVARAVVFVVGGVVFMLGAGADTCTAMCMCTCVPVRVCLDGPSYRIAVAGVYVLDVTVSDPPQTTSFAHTLSSSSSTKPSSASPTQALLHGAGRRGGGRRDVGTNSTASSSCHHSGHVSGFPRTIAIVDEPSFLFHTTGSLPVRPKLHPTFYAVRCMHVPPLLHTSCSPMCWGWSCSVSVSVFSCLLNPLLVVFVRAFGV